MQKQIIKLFWNFSKERAVERNFALITPVVAVVMNAIIAPYVLSRFIDTLQSGSITLAGSWDIITLYATLIFVGEVIIWRLALYFTWTLEAKTSRTVYLTIFNKLAREDMTFHANRFGGSLVSQSTKFTGAYERFWDTIIWSLLPMITTVVGSIIGMFLVGLWQYAVFLGVYAIIFAVTVFIGSRFTTILNRKEAAMSTRSSGYLADMVTNVATVKAFGREKHEHSSAKRYIGDWYDATNQLKWGVLKSTSAFSSLYALGAIGALIFAAYGAEHNFVSAGLVYLVFMYAININRQLFEMNSIIRTYNRIIGDADEMTRILSREQEVTDHGNKKLSAAKGEVVFSDVDFTHDGGKGEHVFSDFSITIPAGQRIGVVGRSGSGKTTLTRVLLRFSDIDAGAICIDGQDISKVTQESLHQSIAYVSQEPMLFHRSLSENIAYGRIDASQAEIEDAARKAHALEFIESLPQGFDTLVGERGVKLSGGQRQRIAIARAILKDAPILVLDEATSALDSESEKLIQRSLDTLMKGRTSIVIAHRLSTISKLDRIIVLDAGKIIEDGTHNELLTRGGVYAKLWSHQSGGFIEE